MKSYEILTPNHKYTFQADNSQDAFKQAVDYLEDKLFCLQMSDSSREYLDKSPKIEEDIKYIKQFIKEA